MEIISKSYLSQKFYTEYSNKIILFQTAERLLKKYLKQGELPIKKWKAEAEEFTMQKERLYEQYFNLKADINEIDDVRREVDEIVRLDTIDRADRYEQRHVWDMGFEI